MLYSLQVSAVCGLPVPPIWVANWCSESGSWKCSDWLFAPVA